MIGQQGVVTALQHSGRKMTHQGLGLDVEVPEHLVRLPTAKQADAICIHVGAKEGHSASCSEGASGDILRLKAVCGAENGYRQTQQRRDVSRSEVPQGRIDRVEVGGEGLCRWSRSEPEVDDAAGKCQDGAKLWVATATQADHFATDTTLLCGELERSEGGAE